MAAAAFAANPDNFEINQAQDLLAIALAREIFRWKEAAPNLEDLNILARLIAIATFIRGFPIIGENDRIFLLNEDQKIFVIKDESGKWTVPTYRWLKENSSLPERLKFDFLSLLDAVSEVTPPGRTEQYLRMTINLCPPQGALQPDLIGEYFLDFLFEQPEYFDGGRQVSYLDDSFVQKCLTAAWKIDPESLIYTLNEFRRTTTKPKGFIRLLVILEKILDRQNCPAEKLQEDVAILIYNAMVKLGGEETQDSTLKLLEKLLQNICAKYPENMRVAYRRYKALFICIYTEPEPERLPLYREIASQAARLIDTIKEAAEQQQCSLANAFFNLMSYFLRSRNNEAIRISLNLSELLLENFDAPQELYETISRGFSAITNKCYETIRENDKRGAPDDLVGLTDVPVEDISENLQKFLHPRHQFKQDQVRSRILGSIINTSLTAAKVRKHAVVFELLNFIRQYRRIKDDIELNDCLVKCLYNAQSLRSDNAERKESDALTNEAFEIFRDGIKESYIDIVLMLARSLRSSIENNDGREYIELYRKLFVILPKLPAHEAELYCLGQFLDCGTSSASQTEIFESTFIIAREFLGSYVRARHLPTLIVCARLSSVSIGEKRDVMSSKMIVRNVLTACVKNPTISQLKEALIDAVALHIAKFGRAELNFPKTGKFLFNIGNEMAGLEINLVDEKGNHLISERITTDSLPFLQIETPILDEDSKVSRRLRIKL